MSLLAQQIARLNNRGGANKRKNKGSLLFSAEDAAEIDAVSLLDLSRAALEELSRSRDGRLKEFLGSLLHPSSVNIDRATMTPAENARLDESISRCLLLLSPHFETKPVHRVSKLRRSVGRSVGRPHYMDTCLAAWLVVCLCCVAVYFVPDFSLTPTSCPISRSLFSPPPSSSLSLALSLSLSHPPASSSYLPRCWST